MAMYPHCQGGSRTVVAPPARGVCRISAAPGGWKSMARSATMRCCVLARVLPRSFPPTATPLLGIRSCRDDLLCVLLRPGSQRHGGGRSAEYRRGGSMSSARLPCGGRGRAGLHRHAIPAELPLAGPRPGPAAAAGGRAGRNGRQPPGRRHRPLRWPRPGPVGKRQLRRHSAAGRLQAGIEDGCFNILKTGQIQDQAAIRRLPTPRRVVHARQARRPYPRLGQQRRLLPRQVRTANHRVARQPDLCRRAWPGRSTAKRRRW